MKRWPIALFLMLGVVQWTYSQSEFLLRGKSGIACGLGISSDHEKNNLTAFAGYSYRGFLDGVLKYSKANKGSVQGGVLSPVLSFYPVKQEDAENIPTLGFSLGFSQYSSKTTTTVIVPDSSIVTWRSYERTTESNINAWTLGVSAQSRTGYWKAFFFQPMLGADFSLTNKGTDFKLRCEVSIGARIVRGPLLIITPGIERQSANTTFTIHLLTVFS